MEVGEQSHRSQTLLSFHKASGSPKYSERVTANSTESDTPEGHPHCPTWSVGVRVTQYEQVLEICCATLLTLSTVVLYMETVVKR